MSRKRHRGVLRRVRSKVGRALGDYAMTADGDRILVAVSGGKDSLALLHILQTRKPWIPVDYQLAPLFVGLGEPGDGERLAAARGLCDRLGLPLAVVDTDIGRRLRTEKLPESHCFHCSRWKRKAIFNYARDHGFAKVAFGHHRDDIIETALLNLFYGSNFSTMVPCQQLFRGTLAIIRPLAYLSAAEVVAYCRQHQLPLTQPPCVFQHQDQKRLQLRRLLAALEKDNPRVRDSIFHALRNVRQAYLLDVGFRESSQTAD
ncbi:MAG: hypothetical protein JRJ56_06825 [Deltaproteobacteria bacterium]|jgi:tRNA 2-thiocytidine biosynthesis protein TtcA|nr:hypothetical protein [Deltaproteobacteria bacterium]